MVRSPHLADLTKFVVIAEYLNFRAAALRLGVTPSALSHSMRQLEEHIGMPLLHRTTRSMALTDAGARLLERIRPAIEQIDNAVDGLAFERDRPFGRLKLYVSHIAATVVVAPLSRPYLSAYPDVQLDLEVGDKTIDLVGQGFSAGIGPLDRAPGDMMSVRVSGPIKMAVTGAPSYFANRAIPRKPSDLFAHSCLRVRRDPRITLDWLFDDKGKPTLVAVDGPLIINDPIFALRAAVDGLGIVYTSEAFAEPYIQSGELIRVLEDCSPSAGGQYLYYPKMRQRPAALDAFINMATTKDQRSPQPRVPNVRSLAKSR
jgi:DNA-binding transcriptional LysR family regulator